MDSQIIHQSYQDNREAEQSRQSQRSSAKYSEGSLKSVSDKNADRGYSDSVASDRARTRTRDPDRDRMSDCEKESERYRLDEYENTSPSDRSRSLSPCSLSPSPSLCRARRANHVSSKRGLQRKVIPRAGSKQPRSRSKDSPPKDLDLVTRRVLSARLLKINEQRNQLSELQLRLDQLQRENRVLRQLQHRQERALQRFDDTESEVAQLISRHGSETHALRERLRRTQERERAADRRLRDAEDELRRARAALQRLRKLADDRQLGERDELARKLAQAQERAQEDQRRVKELERNMELSSGSFQRQLNTERKKTHEVQEEVRTLRDELDRVTLKLKEKERELNTRNIYANRMGRGTPRKDTDSGVRRKGPSSEGSSRCSSKGVQTEEQQAPPDFPTPPPAVADLPEYPGDAGGYLSLKEQREDELALGEVEEQAKEEVEEQAKEKRQGLRMQGEEVFRAQELQEEEKEEKDEDDEWSQAVFQKEERRKGRSPSLFQEELPQTKLTNQDASPQKQEEERRRKEQLLAKMREIDREGDRGGDIFSDTGETKAPRSPPQLRNPQRPSAFSFPEPVENLHKGLPSRDSSESSSGSLRRPAQSGRRGLNPQGAVEDLSFGSYAPSFGQPAGRMGVAMQGSGSGGGIGIGAGAGEEKHREVPDVDPAKEKKSNLMQQLFGSGVANGNGEASKMEVLSPPPAAHKAARHPNSGGGPFPWDTAKNPAARRAKNTLQVTESRPAVRAISSFDEDIEELAL